MRVAQLVSRFPVLGETFILDQITGLLDAGLQVDIVAGFDPHDAITHEKVARYRLAERTTYSRLALAPIQRMLRFPGHLFSHLGRPGFGRLLSSLNPGRHGREALNLNVFYRMEPFLERRYDVFHAQFGMHGVGMLFLKEIFPDVPFVVSFLGYDYSVMPRLKGNDYYQALFAQADAVLVPSEYTRGCLIRLGCPPEKVHKLRLGMEPDLYRFRERHRDPSRPITILTVARMVEKKGLPDAARAIRLVADRFPDVRWWLAGGSTPQARSEMEALIADLKLQDNVELLGVRTKEQLAEIYDQADLYLMTSHTAPNGDQESQGVVLQEAQACGLPVVATEHNGFPESVVPGQSALLVPERDVAGLAEQLIYLIEHPEQWPEMGRIGRAYVEAEFDSRKLNHQLVELYRSLVAHAGVE